MDLLLHLMNLPRTIVDVTRTSDGFYLGRLAGDCGFNAFLGKPNPNKNGTAVSWEKFRALTGRGRRKVVRAARAANVNLRDFLPKGGAA